MKQLFLLFLSLPTVIFPQGRHEKVRQLNAVVDFMNEASLLNQTYYFDAVQLSKAIYFSKEKLNETYFYTSKKQKDQRIRFSGIDKAFRFKELQPDEGGYLPQYMADLIPYLEAKEKVQSLANAKTHFFLDAIDKQLLNYMETMDSLFFFHQGLTDYVSTKAYKTDDHFGSAHDILKKQALWFESCHSSANQLYEAIEQFYLQELPFNKTQPAIRAAEKELMLTVDLMNAWQKELYAGNTTHTTTHDSTLRNLHDSGLRQDSFYLYHTKGYDYLNSGWYAHSRYQSFYMSVKSTLYWYKTHTYAKEPYITKEQQHYNTFVLSYNPIIESYNRFIELADGKVLAETSSCCLSISDIDTNQNVMLKKPRLLYQFTLAEQEITTSTGKAPSSIDIDIRPDDQAMIQKAVPHHLVYLLDASSSMNEWERLDHLKANAKYLVALQRAVDRISMVSFATKAHVILKNKPCHEKNTIYSSIDGIEALGSTNINDGAERAIQLADSFNLTNGKTKILLITDGLFKLSKNILKRITSLKEKNIEFCIIYLGNAQSPSTENEFKAICEKANGKFYTVHSIDLKAVLLKEASE